MNVSFIGVGSMGAAMVPNLVRAGHQVSVWNRDVGAAKALENVTVLPSPAAAFGNEAVVTMLSDDAAVRGVIMPRARGGPEGPRPRHDGDDLPGSLRRIASSAS